MKLFLKAVLNVLSFSFFLLSCSTSEQVDLKIVVSETNGLERDLEYITLEIPFLEKLEPTRILLAEDLGTGASVPIQILDTIENNENLFLKILFPVTIAADSSKTFGIKWNEDIEAIRDTIASRILLSNDGFSIENSVYKATFSTQDDKRGGQINGIVLKNFNEQLLKRSHIAMHWAPNFSESNREGYFNMEDLTPNSKNEVEPGRYVFTKSRSGITDSVPQIFVEGKYTFLAEHPYFIFESTMTVEHELSLNLLRNDEMTMDSLFTHVAYEKANGTLARLQLYSSELDSLETEPIPHNTGFVAFYNTNFGYGLASIRLEYNNSNIGGTMSPLYNHHTKISKAANNGRYWNRVLIDSATTVPKGSKYHEKNAYLVFKVGKEIPEEEILYHAERLRNPLVVTLQEN